MLSTNSGSSCRWLRMFPPLGTICPFPSFLNRPLMCYKGL
jgi:hypothetical protein